MYALKIFHRAILRLPARIDWFCLLGGLLVIAPATASAARCLVPQLPRPAEAYTAARARLMAEDRWQPGRDPALTPPADPQVGDTWLWYIWDLGGFPVASLKPCTVRGLGDHCYVVIDDDEWNVSIDQEDVDRIVQHFDNQSVGEFADQGIWDLNTSHFGSPPNPLDGLERIFLLYYHFGISSDGYFWIFDQYPDGSQAFSSNEADVVYLATDSGDPAGNYMLAVAAHEFQHMIHFNQDQDEDLWLEEGLGELAMWLFGNPDTISQFNSNPDNSLISWGSAWADYIQTYLWTLYCYEQYGGQPMIWDLTHNPANGMTSYQTTLDRQGFTVTMENVFGDWAAANFLDDPSIANGQFGYAGEDLPAFFAFRTHASYPAAGSGSVQSWAADYIRLTNLTGAPTLEFDGSNIRDFRVAMLAVDPALPTLVRFVPLDDNNDGSAVFVEALGYEQVVLAISNVSNITNGSYSYTIGNTTTAVPDQPLAGATLRGSPNPFNPLTELVVTLPQQGRAELIVHDARGRQVAKLLAADLPPGEHRLRWEARDLPSGVYLARLLLNGETVDRLKLSLVK